MKTATPSKLFTESECQHIVAMSAGRSIAPPAQKPASVPGGSGAGLVGHPKPRKAMTGAERVALYRQRHHCKAYTVELPLDVIEGIEQYMRFKNLTRSEVITKLVRSQLLRKR